MIGLTHESTEISFRFGVNHSAGVYRQEIEILVFQFFLVVQSALVLGLVDHFTDVFDHELPFGYGLEGSKTPAASCCMKRLHRRILPAYEGLVIALRPGRTYTRTALYRQYTIETVGVRRTRIVPLGVAIAGHDAVNLSWLNVAHRFVHLGKLRSNDHYLCVLLRLLLH